MKTNLTTLTAAFALATALPNAAQASSHMDAPLITRDPSANTTDVYAFVDRGRRKHISFGSRRNSATCYSEIARRRARRLSPRGTGSRTEHI